jgi:hypothetical protein
MVLLAATKPGRRRRRKGRTGMAKVKKTRGKTAKRAARRGSAKAGRRKAARKGRSAGASAAGKKVAELQAENRRLREENVSLRSQLDGRTGQPDESGLGERPPSLGL